MLITYFLIAFAQGCDCILCNAVSEIWSVEVLYRNLCKQDICDTKWTSNCKNECLECAISESETGRCKWEEFTTFNCEDFIVIFTQTPCGQYIHNESIGSFSIEKLKYKEACLWVIDLREYTVPERVFLNITKAEGELGRLKIIGYSLEEYEEPLEENLVMEFVDGFNLGSYLEKTLTANYLEIGYSTPRETTFSGISIFWKTVKEEKEEQNESEINAEISIIISMIFLVFFFCLFVICCKFLKKIFYGANGEIHPENYLQVNRESSIYEISSDIVETCMPAALYEHSENEVCAICFEEEVLFSIQKGDWIRKIVCHHFFHCKCLDSWFASGGEPRCPLCKTNPLSISSFLNELIEMIRRLSLYQQKFQKSILHPEEFWNEKALEIHWDKPYTKILDRSKAPHYTWFSDGKLNMAYNCIDRHVNEGRGSQTAIIHDSPYTETVTHYSYLEFEEKVEQMAGAMLNKFHIEPGDRVVIYMPMVPEALIAMLACARIGAIHSVVFGGFAAKELGNRIAHTEPALIVTSNLGIEPGKMIPYLPIVDEACIEAEHLGLKDASKIPRVVLDRGHVQTSLKHDRDFDFYEFLKSSPAFKGVVSVSSSHPLYILYTSGTTGEPKGIVRDTGGYATALKQVMKWVFAVDRGSIFWSASDIGWIVGHTLIVYGPLLAGCTTVLYEGKPVGTPDPGAWWRVISQHKVESLFVAPTGVRAIRKEDNEANYMKTYDLNSLHHVGLAGERCDPDTIKWIQKYFPSNCLVNDHWWQTESGWPMISNYSGVEKFEIKPGSATKPVPGWDVEILNEANEPVQANESGKVVVKLPTPPGFMLTLWKNDTGFVEKYMSEAPGYYLAGDEGFYDEHGYFSIMGRTDDVINTAGHRLSTGGMEECISYHPEVAECAVIGMNDELKGEIPVAFVVRKSDSHVSDEEIEKSVVEKVRKDIGAVAALKHCLIVPRLPKTRSGKILRATMRKIAEEKEYVMPSTIEDPLALKDIEIALRAYELL